MQTLWQDARYSLRGLFKSPGFVLAVLVPFSLGIGVNTAIFSVADALLRTPLPFSDIDRMTAVGERDPDNPEDLSRVAPANYLDWKARSAAFEKLAAYNILGLDMASGGNPEIANAALVSEDFFTLFKTPPALGRVISPEEARDGQQVAVLSYGFWKRRFGADPRVVGGELKLDGRTCVVLGVMPKQFTFPLTVDLWAPLSLTPRESADRKTRYLRVVGLLKPTTTLKQAVTELGGIAAFQGAEFPETNRGWGVNMMLLRDYFTGGLTAQYLLMMVGAVLFVLLIACTNVANIYFARATVKRKEVALRSALGASRYRIVRQLLTESTLLALTGSALALGIAQWGIHLIRSNMPATIARFIPGFENISLDFRALMYTIVIAIVAGFGSGFLPALKISRANLNSLLNEGGRFSSGPARNGLQNTLVIAEVGITVTLMVGAVLMVRGMRTLIAVNPGMAPEAVLTVRINLPESRYPDDTARAAFYQTVLPRLQAIPNVRSAALASNVPYAGAETTSRFTLENAPPEHAADSPAALLESVSQDYFRTLDIPLRQGRAFERWDGPDAPPVAIVTAAFASRYWKGANPLGKRLKTGPPDSAGRWVQVVGIADDVRYSWLQGEMLPAIYLPETQAPRSRMYVALRANGDPVQLVGAVRAAIATVAPNLPLAGINTLARVISNSVIGLSYVAVMMTVLGGIALVLSSVGVFGLMSYVVSRQTQEIGLRMALGASHGSILGMVLRRGLMLAGTGTVIGLLASMALALLLSSLIFGVKPLDAPAFAGAALLLFLMALLASYIPARRAIRVDPAVTLRAQ